MKNMKSDIVLIRDKVTQIENSVNKIEQLLSNKTLQKKPIEQKKEKKEYVILPDEKNDNVIEDTQSRQTSSNFTKVSNKANPEEEKPEYNKALLMFSNKDFRGTIVVLEKIAQKEDDPVVITNCYFWLGESNYELKQFEKAIDYFKKVIDKAITDNVDKAQIRYANANMKIGNINEAKKAYNHLLANFPKSRHVPEARKMLQQL